MFSKMPSTLLSTMSTFLASFLLERKKKKRERKKEKEKKRKKKRERKKEKEKKRKKKRETDDALILIHACICPLIVLPKTSKNLHCEKNQVKVKGVKNGKKSNRHDKIDYRRGKVQQK
jgi:flagellar biosynthesis component FlhA